ncbi:TetR/AcrR family transcriptional regulator [Paenarthrobacter sp. Z7-10]|uniref:TetR/AcrR family transcriptional regulator n=1 Tax=Paenarthrobacter sp. Z7-10 TaxID=2787635 RepID=UPI0022A9C1E3|nr:TetR family transcriptional regulator [Paenarthrobacter sp. Z7-10]
MKPDLPRRGRRNGPDNSRELILSSARELFSELGYDATSLRRIAREAGVDAAMVHHYFRDKDELFAACIELPADPRRVLASVVSTAPAERGEAILRTLLQLWDSPVQPALLALVRSAISSKSQAALLREVLTRRIVILAVSDLPGDAGTTRLRGALLVSQLIGLMVSRYILKLEPLASAGHDEVVALVAPTLQHYLTGPLI